MRFEPLTADGERAATGFARHVVPYAIGLAPALLVALTWAPSGEMSRLQGLVRGYSLPVVAAELFAILVALREGLLRSILRWRWPRPVAAAIAVLLLVALGSLFTAPVRSVAATLTLYWIVHLLFALSIAQLCGRVFTVRDLFTAFLAGFALFVAEFFLFLSQIPDWARFDWTYGFMAFSHIRHAGYYLAAMAALGMGAMALARNRGEWAWAWASAAAAFAIALWTGSRGAALAVGGALAAGVLLVPAMRALKSWLGALSAMAAALAVVWVAPAAPSAMMGLTHAVQQTTSGNVSNGRTTIWRNVIEAIGKRPLLGYGEGQMHWVAPFSTMAQPHDFPLQVALAWGLVGLACVAVIAAAYAARALPAARAPGGALAPPFMAMTAIAILSLYDASLYYALPQSIFMACAGAVAAGWSVRRAGDRSASPPATSRAAKSSGIATEASASSLP